MTMNPLPLEWKDSIMAANIDMVFPIQVTDFNLNDHVDLIDDNIISIVFPVRKLMWPIFRNDVGLYMRQSPKRSKKDVAYDPEKVYTLANDDRGAWLFVKHESRITDNIDLVGFVTPAANIKLNVRNVDRLITLPEYGVRINPV
jgi:hypothetical protein